MRVTRLYLWSRFFVLLLLVATTLPVHAQQTVGLVYPETRAPFRLVFDGIRQGVATAIPADRLRSFQLSDQTDSVAEFEAWLQRERPQVVITLGRAADNAWRARARDATQILGAAFASPETHPDATGFSLSPDPSRLFDTLVELQPETRRVWTVADPTRDAWILARAQSEAMARGLALEVRTATDLAEAAKRFVEVVGSVQAKTDAIWLLENPRLTTARDTLPYLVEQAWARDVALISSTLQHARLGALFSVYPDPEPLGRELGTLARSLIEGASAPPLRPTATLRRAINRRIAEHLDLRFDAGRFELVFPEQ